MRIRAYAKINWSLRVLGKRADGFHDLETLFQTISLHDTLTFEPADEWSLVCDDLSIPTDETNLVLRAAHMTESPPMRITLQKRIPAGGGLGGGSSDAAAMLRFLGGTDQSALEEKALRLGSDVPFFLVGGTAYATGRGEVLTPLLDVRPVPLLLLLPEERVSTAEAFRLLRRFSKPLGLERYRTFDLNDPDLINDFEEPVFEMLPRLAVLRNELLAAGAAWARMSGSGSTIAGAFRSAAERDAAMSRFSDVRAVVAETLSREEYFSA